MTTAIVVFAATYVLVAARRLGWLPLDRPAGALLGAVACVGLGVLAPDEALAAIDGRTLLLLFGMMGLGAFLGADGFFDRAALALARLARTPARLLGAIVWTAGALSALITNDAVCVLGAPLVVALVRRHGLRPLPFLLALATAANTGSVATLVGNPQNMLCAALGGLGYREHLVLVGPVAVIALALNHALLRVAFARDLVGRLADDGAPLAPVLGRSTWITLAVIAATVVLYTAGAELAWTAAGGFAIRLALHREEPGELWKRIDFTILLFFAGLFVVVEGLVKSGATTFVFERVALWSGEGVSAWTRLSAIFLVGSNVVSNVPFILVVRGEVAGVPDPRLAWELLAVASTFAGNLTLLGSVANVIVAEAARPIGGLGFWEYLRVGFPLALVTTAVGTAWLLVFGM
jgi:Na+/H+ antiporter NhaD/arsenite permease-like protein